MWHHLAQTAHRLSHRPETFPKSETNVLRANQQNPSTEIYYSLTQCSLTVSECGWHILAGNDERIEIV